MDESLHQFALTVFYIQLEFLLFGIPCKMTIDNHCAGDLATENLIELKL